MKIGLVFSYNENWIGGTYYILNLIRAMEVIPADLAPEIYVFYSKKEEFEYLRAQTNYWRLYELPFADEPWIHSFLNRVSRKLLGRESLTWAQKDLGFDIVFPVSDAPYFSRIGNTVAWIPDFQELYYPAMFSPEERKNRQSGQKKLVNAGGPIVFSSQSALQDFKKLYPDAKNPVEVLRFAVTLPDLPLDTTPAVQVKHGLSGPYFFCANQFWAHKNHRVVLEALAEAKANGNEFFVAFSGKQHDTRNPDFFPDLLAYVKTRGLEDSVRFLGFIDRTEQLLLMKGSVAVIQPSLFEGWSTVVEDCKALDVPLLLSRIDVHVEQTPAKGLYFDASNPRDLLEKMSAVTSARFQEFPPSYRANIEQFAMTFLGLVARFKKKDREKDREASPRVP